MSNNYLESLIYRDDSNIDTKMTNFRAAVSNI